MLPPTSIVAWHNGNRFNGDEYFFHNAVLLFFLNTLVLTGSCCVEEQSCCSSRFMRSFKATTNRKNLNTKGHCLQGEATFQSSLHLCLPACQKNIHVSSKITFLTVHLCCLIHFLFKDLVFLEVLISCKATLTISEGLQRIYRLKGRHAVQDAASLRSFLKSLRFALTFTFCSSGGHGSLILSDTLLFSPARPLFIFLWSLKFFKRRYR